MMMNQNKAGKRPKHIPQRSCIVCRQKTDKRQLHRIVRTPDVGVCLDPTGKRNGRGAYICSQSACWDKLLKNRQILNQALMTEVTDVEIETLAHHRPVQQTTSY